MWGDLWAKKRLESNLGQEEMGGIVGVRKNTIANRERGRYDTEFNLNMMTTIGLCLVLDVDFNALIGSNDSSKIPELRNKLKIPSSGTLQNSVKYKMKKKFNEILENEKFKSKFEKRFSRHFISDLEKENPPWEKIVECIKTCQYSNVTPQDLIQFYQYNKAAIIKQYERKSTNLRKSQALIKTDETKPSK